MSPSFQLLRFVFFYRPWTRVFILLCSLIATVLGLAGPFFQKEFVDLLMQTQSPLHQSFITYANILPQTSTGVLLAAFTCILGSLAFAALTNFLGGREAIIMQRVLAQKLYNKTLEIRADSLKGKSLGELVSVYATDIPHSTVFLEQSLPVGSSIFFPLILTPLCLIYLFGIPGPLIFGLLAVLILFNLFMAFRQSVFFFRFKTLAADRIAYVNEWVQNIRTLRILGWVDQFEKRIFQVREIETDNRVKMVTNGQTMNSISSSVTFFLNIGAVYSLIYFSGQQITVGSLLALLWIVGIFLTRPFRQLPWFFTFVFDSWTSLKRVSLYLNLQNEDAFERPKNFVKLKTLATPEPALQIESLNLRIDGHQILSDISFDVKHGEFVCFVGEVGSGKSLLLLSLLGETGADFQMYKIGENDGKNLPLDQLRQFFTFVPQEGFIMSASLRENVALDYELGSQKDAEIIRSLQRAQFDPTSERLQYGLDTEIGERGVNLSGGQRQRVSLARVDFYQAPIVLLDDCLSAVDVDTEEKLHATLLNGAWKDRTRILVTHRLTILDKADRIFFLKDGKIRSSGSFKKLLNQDEEFRVFAASVATKVSTTENQAPMTPPNEGLSDE